MSHERSETIQRQDGKWINVYGQGLPQAGQQLPNSGIFGSVDEAVKSAQLRSKSFDHTNHDDSELEEFEFRARLEAEQGQSLAPPSPKQAKGKGGFLDEHPNVRTALQIGVPLAATAATIPFTGGMSLPLILGTEMMASLGAETALQATGVSERDPKQLGLAMVAPGVGRTVGGILAGLPRLVPGFGEAARSAITPEMRELPGKIFGGPSAKSLYSQVEKGDVKYQINQFPSLQKAVDELSEDVKNIPFEKLQQDLKGAGLDDLFTQISGALKGASPTATKVAPTVGGKTLATGLPKQTVVTPGRAPGLTFEEAKAATEGFGRIIGKTTDPVLRGNYKKLYGAMLDDMEKAPLPANVPRAEWLAGKEAAKREYARFHLQEATEKAIKTKDGVDIIDPNHIVKWLRTNDEIKKRVSPTEYRAILNQYRTMASTVGHNMSKFTAMLLGGFASGGAGGALTGYLGAEQLSKAMLSEPGRKVVRALMSNPSESNFRRFTMLTGVGSGAALRSGQGVEEEAQ